MDLKFVPDSARLTLFTSQTTPRFCVLAHYLLVWGVMVVSPVLVSR
jgi:hypothetical protein